MTRQLIICSALIASVAAPALAGTVPVSNPAAGARATNPAGVTRVTNPAAWQRRPIPVDFTRASNPAGLFGLRADSDSIRTGDAAAFKASNPASIDRLSNIAGSHRVSNLAGIPRDFVHPDVIVIPNWLTNPVQLRRFRLVCWSNAVARDALSPCERIVRDPPMPLQRVRADLSPRQVITRPIPGRVLGIQFHTPFVNGRVDNQ